MVDPILQASPGISERYFADDRDDILEVGVYVRSGGVYCANDLENNGSEVDGYGIGGCLDSANEKG
jgi:hypothetical protein